MDVGVLFPQTEIGADPAGLRDFAQAVVGLGFTHLVSYEHVLGAVKELLPKDYAPFGIDDPFHEVLTTYAYMAGAAPGLGLATGILVLPQRQTALVAKQAAQLAILTGGRFRLGVGIGWNAAEFASLGQAFSNWATRMEEQIELMRLLWTQPVVNFEGRFESVLGCGLCPLPAKPVPLWIGARAESAMRRAAVLGDGFFPLVPLKGDWNGTFAQMREWREAAGRSWDDFGIEARVGYKDGWRQEVEDWRQRGVTHLYLSTSGCGRQGPAAHIALLEEMRKEL